MAKSKKSAGKPTQNPTPQPKQSEGGGEKQGQLNDLLKRRKDLEAEILELKKQILAEDKKDAEQIDIINRYEEKRTKNLKEYHELSDKISKIRKQDLEHLEKTEKIEKDKEKRQKEEEQKIKEIKEHHEDIQDLQEKAQVLMRSLSPDLLFCVSLSLLRVIALIGLLILSPCLMPVGQLFLFLPCLIP